MGFRIGEDGAGDGAGARVGGPRHQGAELIDRRPGQPGSRGLWVFQKD